MTTLPLASEAAKYRRLYATGRYGLDSNAPALADAFLRQIVARPGQTVLDLGSGSGAGAAYFVKRGLRCVALEIAENALHPVNRDLFPLVIAPLWEPGMRLEAHWGFCCYTLQHLPPEALLPALDVCRTSTSHGCFFQISLRKDGWGQVIGETLHLIVQPADWWENQLMAHWPRVRCLGVREGEWATFLCLPH